MAVTVYILDGTLLTGAAATYGTASPALTRRIIRSMSLYNGTAAAVQCDVHLIASGDTLLRLRGADARHERRIEEIKR